MKKMKQRTQLTPQEILNRITRSSSNMEYLYIILGKSEPTGKHG